MATIGTIDAFVEGKEDFENYLERFEYWLTANAISDDRKQSVFLSVIGATAYGILKHLLLPAKPNEQTYAQLKEKLCEHYKPKPVVIAERFRFHKRMQRPNESIADYVVALKVLAKTCEYNQFLDQALRDQFVCGLSSETVQKRLLCKTELTFKGAMDIALAMDLAQSNANELGGKTTGNVDRVTFVQSNHKGKKKSNSKLACYRCGGKDHDPVDCPFKDKECFHCNKVGHIAKMCRNRNKPTNNKPRRGATSGNQSRPRGGHSNSTSTRYVEEEPTDTHGASANTRRMSSGMSDVSPTDNLFSIFTTTETRRPKPGAGREDYLVEMTLEGVRIPLLVDTGSAFTIISRRLYEEKFSHLLLEQCGTKLQTYTGENIPTQGQFEVTVEYKGQVTGSNIGIGFAIVRSLCKKLQSTDVVYLTSRSQTLGLEAVEKLKSEGLSPSYHQLDIADEGSTRRLKEHLEKTHGGVDILINNAGVLLRDNEIPFLEKVECTMKTNFYDTLKAYNILSPIIRPHGRVVFVSGGFGLRAYNQISEELKKSFREAKTEDDVQRLMGKFVSDVKAGNHIELGWLPGDDGNPPYSVSKLGIMAVTKVLAENLPKDPREGILINSCCPGYVATDLTENMGEKTVEEGAVTSVILALIPKGSSHPQGQYLDSYQQYQDFLTE